METRYSLGIDWGGTRIKIGAVNAHGQLIEHHILDTPQIQNIEDTVTALIDQAAGLIQAMGEQPYSIGLGLTGPVDPDFGVVLLPGKVKGLEQYPIVPRFREHFGLPVFADNDGTVALVAERAIGQAKGVDWAVALTIGTGVGSGVMIEGRIPRDPNFMFGIQMGHLIMNSSNDQLCLIGARGTGEMSCSATALALAVRSGLQRGIPSILTERYFDDPHSIDFQTIIEDGVKNEDALCLDELRRWQTQLGWLVVNAIHAYSPQVVILSGGATLAAEYFLPSVQKHVDKHLFRYTDDGSVPVVVSSIQEYAGVIGAALMSRERTG